MSFNISAKVVGREDVAKLLKQLGDDADAAARIAVTGIGEHMQAKMRAELPNRFRFRGTLSQFNNAVVFQAPKVTQKKTIEGVLRVGTEHAQGSKASATNRLGAILARHEEGGERTASNSIRLSTGATHSAGFFIPSGALRSSSQNPPRAMYPANVGAVLRNGDGKGMGSYYAKSVRKTRKSSGVTIMGESFVITEKGIFRWKHGFGGTTNRHGGTFFDRAEPMWWFTRRIRTPRRLGLWLTAEQVFDASAIGHILAAIDTVIERGGGR